MHSPESETEWREAVDSAVFMLNWHAGRLYGVVQGGPTVNVERCEHLIEQARERGITIPTVADVMRRRGLTPLRERRDTRGTRLDELAQAEQTPPEPDSSGELGIARPEPPPAA